MARELVLWLMGQGHQPLHLKPSLKGDQALTSALDEAIALREQGRAELSLELLLRLQAAGHRSPWIQDNIARVQLLQGHPEAAAALWRELQGQGDAQAAAVAEQMLEQLQRQLLEGLMLHCNFHSWPPRHLPRQETVAAVDLLDLALREAISSREAGKPGLSLALMEEAIQQGWQNPWLHDNRARALVNLGRREEAIGVWQELSGNADGHAAGLAREALAQQERLVERDAQLQQAENLLHSGQPTQAEPLLLQAWLTQPDDPRIQRLLEQTIPPKTGGGDLLDQELAAVNHRLAVQEWLQEHLEQLLG
jgi:predicted Zn-dependent protease